MEQQIDHTGIPWSWRGALCGIVMVGIFFDLREYVAGPPREAVLMPLTGTSVPRDPLVAIAWLVITTLPLSWFWVRALTRENYRNAFCYTYSFTTILVPWFWALVNIPMRYFFPSHFTVPANLVDAFLLTGWFMLISVVTVVSVTIVGWISVWLKHTAYLNSRT